MRQVGKRREQVMTAKAEGVLLAEGARFVESVARLAPATFVPKGVHRYRSHDDAERHRLECLARGTALLARGRAR